MDSPNDIDAIINKIIESDSNNFNDLLECASLSIETDLVGIELKDVDLSGVNLCCANLEYSDLENANVSNSNLEKANLSNCNLKNAKFNNACLVGANFMGADLSGTDFTSANLSNAIFTHANISTDTIFHKAILDLDGIDNENILLAFRETSTSMAVVNGSQSRTSNTLHVHTSYESRQIEALGIEDIQGVWQSMEIASSFIPGASMTEHRFYRVRIKTTGGYVKNEQGIEKYRPNSITIVKDPIRPYDIQISEIRSICHNGSPAAIPDILNLDLSSVRAMYPFLLSKGYKWLRMVLAELATDRKILDFIYENDIDRQVKEIVAKNPSASSELQCKECHFCCPDFIMKRDRQLGSEKTYIIPNDFPYGPYFHYIAFPRKPVHAWEKLEVDDIVDMNLSIWQLLKREQYSRNGSMSAGVFIGLNSSARHLVMGTHTRTSSGSSTAHVHKQIWGMAPGSVNLGNHIHDLIKNFRAKGDYLKAYYELLKQEDMILYEDDYVVLYVPFGQITVNELQIMVKAPGKSHYLALTEAEVRSLSIAEAIAVKFLEKLKISSFNEIMITLPFDKESSNFRLIMCFLTSERDMTASELNHLYVVDKYPEDTRDILRPLSNHLIEEVLSSAER